MDVRDSQVPSITTAQPAKVLQALAIAYADRLSRLRCNASAAQLEQSARLIANLERQCRPEAPPRTERVRSIDVRDATDGSQGHATVFRLDSAVYLG